MATKKTTKKVAAPKGPTYPVFAVINKYCDNFEGFFKTHEEAQEWIKDREDAEDSDDEYDILTISYIDHIIAERGVKLNVEKTEAKDINFNYGY